ncbi:SecY-interacting protein [Pseudoalteromonas atlantica]|uniref:SecY-interacting protein n=1 Tax=Pseudoalteromonas atlantica TaxID=288 RepID=UPI0037360024
MSIVNNLEQLHKKFAQHTTQKTGRFPLIEQDSNWPSPCEIGDVDEHGQIQWQAVHRENPGSLIDLAKALDVTFPEALNQYYGSFFGGCIIATIEEHEVELLQAWSDDDFDLLQQNITGHVLMKRKLKQKPSVFIGLTEQEDLLVTVLLESGEVCLEYVGKQPHHVLAPNLEEFVKALKV